MIANDNVRLENIPKIMQSFLDSKYIYTTIVNVTKYTCTLLQCNKDCIPSFPEFMTYSEFAEKSHQYVHQMFIAQLTDRVSKESLIKIRDNKCNSKLELLHYLPGDDKYHWITLDFIPVDDGSDDLVFILTAQCTDKEKADREKDKEAIFNKTVMNQLTANYILVHLVDLNTSMSRLVHACSVDKYETYANKFDSHIELMNDLCDKFVQPAFQNEFSKYYDYGHIKCQLITKEHLLFVFKDQNDTTFELNVTKYPDYSSDSPLVIYAIKEIT